MKRRVIAALWVFGLLLVSSDIGKGERLPIKTYTTAEGLSHNSVNRIVRDSRGFLWFCTGEGLSRFDGYSFTNYGIDDGLPSAMVTDLLETGKGIYWVATAGGLCRFNPLGKPQANAKNASEGSALNPMFAVYSPADDVRSKYVSTILEDQRGVIWCGTRNGLYRVEAAAGEIIIAPVDLGVPDYLESRFIQCLLVDRFGTLWIGLDSGLYRRWPDGRIEATTLREGLRTIRIRSLLQDREGSIWVGTAFSGLYRLRPDESPGRAIVARFYEEREGLPTMFISHLFQTSDGSLWAGSSGGLIRFIPTPEGGDFRFRVYSQAHGLSFREVGALGEDRNGNLWAGMRPGGAAKLARGGFTTFDKADGFFWSGSIFESRAGDLFVVGGPNRVADWFINRFDTEKFVPILPRFPEGLKAILNTQGFGWGWNHTVLEDSTGEWWFATRVGLFRFPRVRKPEQLADTPPKAIYTIREGLASNVILLLFEDSRGDIWISSVGEGKGPNGLSRWERSTGTFHHFTAKDDLPGFDEFFVSSFVEDRAGNVWIGFSGEGGLVRHRDEQFTLFTAKDGMPAGQIRDVHIDIAGRLWAASYRGGLCRIDEPAVSRPTILTYTTAGGLSSNEVSAVSEDQWGRIYIGTGRGIDRLDPETGLIKHYTTADGLPLGQVMGSLRDHTGAMWFSFQAGAARLVPEPDPQPVPPPILITGLRIAGQTLPISALGEIEIAPIELSPDRNQLQIDFVALGFSPGEGLRYQYKLEGAGEQWSQLADQRTVNFANLAPGRYRFLVQAINADGVASERSAGISFTVLSPIWQRWWFLTLAAVLLGVALYSMFRYRLAQKLKVERVRTRIATDLHDDIGTNLSLIAMASQVARQRSHQDDRQMSEALSLISTTSSELVDSMSDIVWAVNPGRDRLVDLIKRMRRFASDLFSASSIAFRFDAPSEEPDLPLGTETRREILLIYKEAVNNIARHSKCTLADTELEVHAGWLILRLHDNGVGFDVARPFDGNGLVSMSQRAEKMGGRLRVVSNNGEGTTLTLRIPLK